MKIKDIAEKIEKIVPLKLAQDWDNVGLLIGDPRRNVKNILLTIDITKDVLAEAKRSRTDLIISYHPVIWDGLKKINRDDIVYDLIQAGIAVFSIHTALDAVVGGVNDGLAEIVGIVDGKPIGDYVESPQGNNYKLVVFVPAESVAKVSNAIFAAGAGAIGNYSNCGFIAEGTGTFLPLAGARPAIGKKGKLEKVNEIRFETIVPAEKLDNCIAAMKKAHPYEEPAFDVFKLYDNQSKFGLGRIGKLQKPTQLKKILERIKKNTGARAFGIVGNQNRLIRTAAVCAGSCGKIINLIIAAKTDLYLTGELKHHQALAAQEAGLTCICLSHTVSERFILKKFAKQLQKQIGQVTIKISRKDADPFKWKTL
ncbi:MAG: Nif3-like dinuclear metal center hexameric protein [Phycisphaerae bacterium]|nr:Nif3-like dinuclear metal center hexameric protein [Phycisphaerae bacterium]MDD5381121.1 Nif3-like dinuclear metal center hexameric protein [Phycisphaerae bacterium]